MMKQKIRAVSLLCALLMGLTAAGCGRQETPPVSSGVSGVSQSTAPGETAGTDTITDPSATQGTESLLARLKSTSNSYNTLRWSANRQE